MMRFKRLMSMLMALTILFSMSSMCVSAQASEADPQPDPDPGVVAPEPVEPEEPAEPEEPEEPQWETHPDIESLEFDTPVVVYEGVHQVWGTNSQGVECTLFEWMSAIRGTVHFVDGTSTELRGANFDLGGDVGYGLKWEDDQSPDNVWTAGNTYTGTLSAPPFSMEVQIEVRENPIQSVVTEPVRIMANTNGQLRQDTDPETGEMSEPYYYYNWNYDLRSTVYFTEWGSLKFNGPYISIDNYDVYMIPADPQSAENPWLPGNTYYVPATLGGVAFQIPVEIVDTPVEGFDLETVQVMENCNGRWMQRVNEETGETEKYFQYDWTPHIKGFVRLTDDTALRFEGTYVDYDGGQWIQQKTNSQSFETPWVAGNTYTETISLMGFEQQVQIEVLPSPVERVELNTIQLIEGLDCETRWEYETDPNGVEFQYYSWREKVTGTVYLKDGTTIELNGAYIDYQGKTMEIPASNSQNALNLWSVDNTYTETINVLGVECPVQIQIIKTPVTSIQWKPRWMVEGHDGVATRDWDYESGDYGPEYTKYHWHLDLHGTIYFSDGSTGTIEWGNAYWNGESLSFECNDDQSASTPWVAGNTYYGEYSVLGYTCQIPVEIIASPISSIVLKPTQLVAGLHGYETNDWYEDSQTMSPAYWVYDWWNQLRGTVYFTDGTSQELLGSSISWNDRGFGIDYENNQSYDNTWEVGNTYTVKFKLAGYEMMEDISIVDSPFESVELEDICLFAAQYSGTRSDYNEQTGEYSPEYNYYRLDPHINGKIKLRDGGYLMIEGSRFEYNGSDQWASPQDDQTYETRWEVGNTYEASVRIFGKEYTVKVHLVASPIERVEFEPINITMGTHCDQRVAYDQETGEERVYYYYSWEELLAGTIYFIDGTSQQLDGGRWFYWDGSQYCLEFTQTQQSFDTRWGPGEHTVQMRCESLDFETTLTVSITAPQADSLTLDAFTIVSGATRQEGKYFLFTPETSGLYYFTSYRDPQVQNVDPRAALMTVDGDKLAEDDDDAGDWNFIITCRLEAGQSYYLYVSTYTDYAEDAVDFPISVSEFFIKDVKIDPAVVTEWADGYWSRHWMGEDDAVWYFRYEPQLSGMLLLKDGSNVPLENNSFEYNGTEYYVNINSNQDSENTWVAGCAYPAVAVIAGLEVPFSVTVVDSPVANVTLDPLMVEQESNGYWWDDGETRFFYYFWQDRLNGTVTLEDGSSFQFSGGGFWYDGEYYDLESDDPQHRMQPLLPGNTYEMPTYLCGQVLTVSVTIAEVRNNGQFEYMVGSDQITITRYVGDSSDVTIPETIDGLPVTAIRSLGDEGWITSLYIPDSVTYIDTSWFADRFSNLQQLTIGAGISEDMAMQMMRCLRIQQVHISENHLTLCSIDGVVYNKELTYTIFYPYWKDEFHQVPDTVTDIQAIIEALAASDGAIDFAIGPNVEGYVMEDNVLYDLDKTEIFYVNKQAEGEYVMPDSVVYINDRAFAGSGFSKVTVSPSVTQITYCAFIGSLNLNQVQLPADLESIEEAAFAECENLESVSIGENVTSIGYNAFKNCYNLNRVDIQSVDDWCNIWFDGRNANPLHYAGNLFVNGQMVTHLDLTGVSAAYIQQYAFAGLNADTVVIPGSIDRICFEAFYNANIQSVALGEGLTYIGEAAFYGSAMTAVTLPSSLKTIDQNAFAYCSNLSTVTFQGNGLEIAAQAFYDCPIENLDLQNICYIGDYAFVYHRTPYIQIPAGMKYLGESSLGISPYLRGVEIPEDMQSLRCLNGSDRLEHVLYMGTEEMWEKLIYAGDAKIAPTTVHCNATGSEVYSTETGYSCRLCDFQVIVEKDEPDVPTLYISRQPESVQVELGKTANISFEAVGEGLRYTWYYADAGVETFKVSSSNSNTYSTKMTATKDGRRVYCVVTDKYGQTVTTDMATMTIAAACDHEFADATCTAPKTCTICGATEGEALGHSYNAVVTEPTCTEDGYTTYTCSGCGDSYVADVVAAPGHDFADATLTAPKTCKVCGATEGEPLKPTLEITRQPESVQVELGKTANISFEAVGEGLTYTWYYANKGAETFKKTSTYKSNIYNPLMRETLDGRRVYCVVTDQYGQSVTTETVTLNLLVVTAPLEITRQPESVQVELGKTASISFEASGDGLTYTWYYADAGVETFKISSSNSNTYSTTMTASKNGRRVYCVVTDQYGQTVTTETVTMEILIPAVLPEITRQPASVYVGEGKTANISFEATGEGLTYTWYYADAGVETFKISSSNSNTYSTTMTASKNGRRVYCVVTDRYGQSVTTDTVTMQMTTPLVITRQPVTAAVPNGANAQIDFEATGEGLTYKWYYANAGVETFKLSGSFTGTSYNTVMTASKDGRRVYCVITDKYGQTVTTDVATMYMAAPLEITRQPESVQVQVGQQAQISFETSGEGDLTYTWYYADAGAETFKKSGSFTGNSYNTAMTEAKDGRRVYCVVTDQYGRTVTTETVTINLPFGSAPVITRQPESVTVAKNQTASISFEATGEGLTYAWYYANAGEETFRLSGSSTGNTYSTAMTASKDGRRVYCVITDQYGQSVTTDIVTMTLG